MMIDHCAGAGVIKHPDRLAHPCAVGHVDADAQVVDFLIGQAHVAQPSDKEIALRHGVLIVDRDALAHLLQHKAQSRRRAQRIHIR